MTHNGKKRATDGLKWPPLTKGILIKRYKRFLADVRLDDGRTVTAHCANSGTMKACAEPGRPVYLSYHDNPRRKLKYTWELIDMPTSLVGINTQVPNRLVKNSIERGRVRELRGYEEIRSEVKVSDKSRLDLMLKNKGGETCYVEVKNCTLVLEGEAFFPDAVTKRGQKHLLELESLLSDTTRCVIFFLVQRMDATAFCPADHIDPEYGKILRRVNKRGVEIVVYDVAVDLEKIALNRSLPYNL